MRRSSFTGSLAIMPSVVRLGMVNCTKIREPRWTAAKSLTRAGTLASGGSGSPMYPHPVASRAATTLPVRIWRSIQADLIGVALHIENARLGLVHALAGVFHDGAPLIGTIHG